jgi:predicted transcriptional regulator
VNLKVVAAAVLVSYASVTERMEAGGGAGSGIVPLLLQEKNKVGNSKKKGIRKTFALTLFSGVDKDLAMKDQA